MNTNKPSSSDAPPPPWWQVGMVWLVLGGPATVVVAGIVTAPLNKEAMHLAGYTYPGHTELLAEQFGVTPTAQ